MHTDLDDPGDDSNDYLDGLEGFFNEDTSTKSSASRDTKKSSLSKTQPSKKGTPRPKRRQPTRRTVINIDDLLDGIDLPSVKRDDSTTSPHISSPHAASSDAFSMPPSPTPPECSMRMESNLQTYISAQFNSLRDDFLCELERMLSENDIIDGTVAKFLVQMKDNLREIFQNVENVSSDRSHRVVSSVESMLPSFKELIKTANRQNSDEKENEIEQLSLSQVSLSSFVPVLSDSFRLMTDDLNRDIGDLRTTQSKVRKSDIKMKQQRRIAFEGVLELESRKIKQDIDTQTISELSQVLSEFRRSLKNDDDIDDIYSSEPDESDNSKKLRSSISKLRKQIESFNAESLSRIKSWKRRFDEYIDEVTSIREMEHFNRQRFITSGTNAIYLAAQPVLSPVPTPPSSPPRVSFVDDYQAPASPVREEPRPLMLESVRKRLQLLNEERAAVLESSVNFMEDVHRQEKRRLRMSK